MWSNKNTVWILLSLIQLCAPYSTKSDFLEDEFPDTSFANASNNKIRTRRGAVFGSIFFTERASDIRERLFVRQPGANTQQGKKPLFGGLRDYANTVQVLSHTRNFRDGPVGGWFLITTGDAISLSVDYSSHENDVLYWTMFGGTSETRCLLQRLYGNGQRVVFSCPEEGNYYGFFCVHDKFANKESLSSDKFAYPRNEPEAGITNFNINYEPNKVYGPDTNLFISEYKALLQPTGSQGEPCTQWYHSDPIRILKDVYCYRWAFRLIKENEVGFTHFDPNPVATDGSYYAYSLKVWVIDPAGVTEDELYTTTKFDESIYSRIITRRFKKLGLTPCLRFAHKSVEVTKDAIYFEEDKVPVLPSGAAGLDTGKIRGPHWEFHLKVYMDRIISTLSDLSVTITPRQHSALYGCFIGDVRLFIPGRKFSFFPAKHEAVSRVLLNYTNMSPVRKRFLQANANKLFGHRTFHVRSPWILDRRTRVDPVIFHNPCVSQELAISWDGSIGITNDHLVSNPIIPLVLTSFKEKHVSLKNTHLRLSKAFLEAQTAKENQYDSTNWRNHMEIVDLAFTPGGIVVLTTDSSVYLHPTNQALKGISYISRTRKYNLGRLVKRRWCASTVTPKSNNMWVPAYSRDGGHIIVIYHIPVEGTVTIGQNKYVSSCEHEKDSTPAIKKKTAPHHLLTEKQIHSDEVEDTKIDAQVEEKLRSQGAIARKRREAKRIKKEVKESKIDLDEARTYWFAGERLLDKEDLHFASGFTEPSNARIAKDNSKFNENIIFRLEQDFRAIRKSFESNGLTFTMDEKSYTTASEEIQRTAENSNSLFTIHAVEFSAVEKRFLVATGFQSLEFERDVKSRRDTIVIVTSITAEELPVNLQGIVGSEILLDKVEVGFSGSIIERQEIDCDYTKVREIFFGETKTCENADNIGSEYYTMEKDFYFNGDIQGGKKIIPPPLSKYVSTLYTINTAIPLYIIRLNHLNIFASMDGSFAKPLLCYVVAPRGQIQIPPSPFLPVDEFDSVVTEHGLFSALSRKKKKPSYEAALKEWNINYENYVSKLDDTAMPEPEGENAENENDKKFRRKVETEEVNKIFIGSVLSQEPLRSISPFLPSEENFQTISRDGEILYGRIGFEQPTKSHVFPFVNPPVTTFKSIPFWSLLKGSVAQSAENNPSNQIDLDAATDFATYVQKNQGSSTHGGTKDSVCPFGSFVVDYVLFPYVEAKYKTRITAEVAYYGDSIPLEADIIVEFSEVTGVSVVISSFLTVDFDQTIIRKFIDIETFITPPILEKIYKRHETHQDEAIIKESLRVFTLTIRPSMVNLHCEKKDYFKTIQLNIGCVNYLFKMRLISEALPLRKISVHEYKSSTSDHELSTRYFFDKSSRTFYAPRDRVHFTQRKTFNCAEKSVKFCKIPVPPHLDIRDNFFGLSFRDVLVPKFEQFLTKHVRRISGNVVMYDLLGSQKADPQFQMETNTTQKDAGCIADDKNWYSDMAVRAAFFENNSLPIKTDVYRFFNNCFSTVPIVKAGGKSTAGQTEQTNSKLLSPQELAKKKFWLFNQTNRNALKLPRKRNYIFFIRAVVVNTDYNSFTYCEQLDTFFALQVVNLPPSRKSLGWELYLGILLLVFFFLVCCYVYFSKSFTWRTELITNKQALEDEEAEDELLTQLAREEAVRKDPFHRLAHKVNMLHHWRKMASKVKQTAGERDGDNLSHSDKDREQTFAGVVEQMQSSNMRNRSKSWPRK